MRRYWINQPSTLQPHHNMHGENVLCDMDDPAYEGRPVIQVWFLHGAVWSADIMRNALSEGWKPKPPSSMGSKLKESEFLYVRSMGKAHRVTAIFTDDDAANAHMVKTDEAVMAVMGPFILLARTHDLGVEIKDR